MSLTQLLYRCQCKHYTYNFISIAKFAALRIGDMQRLIMNEVKRLACDIIDQSYVELNKISQSIWHRPELGYNEHHAHSELTDFLEKSGFNVEKSFKLDTAFRATYSNDSGVAGPNIAMLCEYDALPGIGHACGHNLIAEIGIAAATGVKGAMIAAKDKQAFGKLTVIGCPAEEGFGGKVDLIQAGAFKDVDIAMMAHPSQLTMARPKYVSMTPLTIKYHGKPSHACSYPWDGINALDAAVSCYTNISCMRQQMKQAWRVHGVIRNGGAQPNIIPEETELEYYLRTPTDAEMSDLKSKVEGCVKAAALATGCTVDYEFGEKSYSNLLSNNTLANLFETNASSIGVEFEMSEERKQKFGGSTDMGNVSHIIPSIHPKFYMGTPVANHTKEFATAAGKEEAQKYTLNIAKGLAMTALDLYRDEELLAQARSDFQQDIQS